MSLVIVGKVISGKSEGKKFIALAWVKRQIQEKIGFIPYEGTLNLTLNKETCNKYQMFVKPRRGITIVPITSRFSLGKCFKVTINEVISGAIVIPLIPNYPPCQVEVISPMNLRTTLQLEDGHEVYLKISNSTDHQKSNTIVRASSNGTISADVRGLKKLRSTKNIG